MAVRMRMVASFLSGLMIGFYFSLKKWFRYRVPFSFWPVQKMAGNIWKFIDLKVYRKFDFDLSMSCKFGSSVV